MKSKKSKKILKWGIFIVYIIALTYFVFFAESMGRVDATAKYRYNLKPMKEILRFWRHRDTLGIASFLNIGGNVAAFIPFGFCLPLITEHKVKFIAAFFYTFGLTLSIELIQLVSKVGSFDVDDIILNLIGGIIGYFLFVIFDILYKYISSKRAK